MRKYLIGLLSIFLISSAYAEGRKYNYETGKGDIVNDRADEISVADIAGYFGYGTTSPPTVESALQEVSTSNAAVSSTYVPYIGATGDVNLGSFDLSTSGTASPAVVHATTRIDIGSSVSGTIQKDASDNLIFYDIITGSKTLSQLASAGAETDPIVGAINGIAKADGGGNISTATMDVDYLKTLLKDIVTISPLAGGENNVLPGAEADLTLSIADAVADSSTKGAATFTTNDFNSSSGNISLDYANGQVTTGTQHGFLSDTDWTTFNSKLGSFIETDTLYSVVSRENIAGQNISASGIVVITGDGTASAIVVDTQYLENTSASASGLINIRDSIKLSNNNTASASIVHATQRVDIGSSNFATLSKDDSNNLILTDSITGNKTLAQLATGSGATTALDNLASVAINTALVSDITNTDDLGTSSVKWKDLYLAGKLSDGTNTATVSEIKTNFLNTMLAFFKLSVQGGLAKYNLIDGLMDEFEDETGVDTATSTNENYDSVNDLYSPTSASYASQYPPEHSDTYVKATSYVGAGWEPWRSTDPANSLTGGWNGTNWLSGSGNTNQRFHIDLGSAKVIKRIYYENSHNSGGSTPSGAQNFTFWGSNTAGDFADLVYANDGTWVQITPASSAFNQHVGLDQVDPYYITVTNTTAYRYYAFKFADNWTDGTYLGVRRIELQSLPANNMTLVSNAYTSEAVPTKSRIVLFEEDVDSITVNTDIKAYVSRDGGATFTQHTLVDEGDFGSGQRILSSDAVDISAQPSGSSIKWKVETLNSKDLKLHAVGASWD